MARFGIDFGTRNTAVTCPAGRLDQQGRPVPSAIAYNIYNGKRLIGLDAIAILRSPPDKQASWRVIRSFKTRMESTEPILETADGWKSAGDIARDYLEELFKQAGKRGFLPAEATVMSIPVQFPARSRQQLFEAVRNCGLPIRGLVSESTAAFLAERSQGPIDRVAVVDWGAGTLDVSILRILGSGAPGTIIEEQSCEGSRIAGDAIDLAIYESLCVESRAKGRAIPQLKDVPLHLQTAILDVIEDAKILLSDPSRRLTSQPVFFDSFSDGSSGSFLLTGDQLTHLLRPIFKQVFETIEHALDRAGIASRQLDRILFIGGCVSVLGFRQAATERYSARAVFPPNPDWAVAEGALQLTNDGSRFELTQEFGCVLDDGEFCPLHHERTFGRRASETQFASTEATDRATLVIAERTSFNDRPRRVGTLDVPLQGHIGEPIRVHTHLRDDLTIKIAARSLCGSETEDTRILEIDDTRFRFRLE
jgi:molecular chaperone DnaK (HSP70)